MVLALVVWSWIAAGGVQGEYQCQLERLNESSHTSPSVSCLLCHLQEPSLPLLPIYCGENWGRREVAQSCGDSPKLSVRSRAEP